MAERFADRTLVGFAQRDRCACDLSALPGKAPGNARSAQIRAVGWCKGAGCAWNTRHAAAVLAVRASLARRAMRAGFGLELAKLAGRTGQGAIRASKPG